jgi:hypothetical protein
METCNYPTQSLADPEKYFLCEGNLIEVTTTEKGRVVVDKVCDLCRRTRSLAPTILEDSSRQEKRPGSLHL